MDTDSFIAYIKIEDIYSDIPKEVETTFDTSNFKLGRPLPKGKNKKLIGLMKDKLGGNIATEFAALKPKTYSYFTDDSDKNKKVRGPKKCVVERKLRSNSSRKQNKASRKK